MIVKYNVLNVNTFQEIVCNVLETELMNQTVIVQIILMILVLKNAHHVMMSVKLVMEVQKTVLFVQMDMKIHQLVIQSHHLPNQLRLEMYQSDLLKFLIVLNNVLPVLQHQLIVNLVMLTETPNQYVYVMMDSLKKQILMELKYVHHVHLDVINVPHLISVLNVLEIELLNQIVVVM
jgi:hypothetical protein